MCVICGCDDEASVTISDGSGAHVHVLEDGTVIEHTHDHDHDHEHDHHHHDHDHAHDHEHGHDHAHAHAHDHSHAHAHSHDHGHSHTHAHDHSHDHIHAHDLGRAPASIEVLETRVLAKNDQFADRNRAWMAGRKVLSLNVMSSPGSGKTTLLEHTLAQYDAPMSVVEGDQETERDAERLRATGAKVVQVNTGKGCHLEADMVWHGMQRIDPAFESVLFIENVGNLVCPALFDLGESARVVLFSVTEGEDKPIKYPHMFRTADVVLMTKIDLLPYVPFDADEAEKMVREVNPDAPILRVSATAEGGLHPWFAWMDERRAGEQSS